MTDATRTFPHPGPRPRTGPGARTSFPAKVRPRALQHSSSPGSGLTALQPYPCYAKSLEQPLEFPHLRGVPRHFTGTSATLEKIRRVWQRSYNRNRDRSQSAQLEKIPTPPPFRRCCFNARIGNTVQEDTDGGIADAGANRENHD
jgi:hypothetical protein